MSNHALWNQLQELKTQYRWVDLTHELSPETPHWYGFQPLGRKLLFDFDVAPMKVHEYTMASQYGTHADVPGHFHLGMRLMHEIRVDELAYPLCVIDKSEACKQNPDYALTKEDILEWEAVNGQIPEGAFVAFRSDWSKRSAAEYDNKDAEGNSHYPGWDLDCVKWLDTERKIGAIGHETSDTDPACRQPEIGFAAEDYILKQDKLNVEVMAHLDEVPPAGAIIFVVFPKLRDGTGFPTRCFAVCPR